MIQTKKFLAIMMISVNN